MTNSRRLCIIPARGGSKRILNKNIRPFCGRPIIAYSIEAARKSELFDEIMVSTDTEEIARIALHYGAKVPFLRSHETSGDTVSTAAVWHEVLVEYEKIGRHFDVVLSIYPTAPFATAKRLCEAVKMLEEDPSLDSVIPVVAFESPIERGMRLHEGRIKPIWPEHNSTRTQDLEPAYFDAGQYYAFRVESLRRLGTLRAGQRAAVILSALETQDIDTEEGWHLAELKFQLQQSRAVCT